MVNNQIMATARIQNILKSNAVLVFEKKAYIKPLFLTPFYTGFSNLYHDTDKSKSFLVIYKSSSSFNS